MGVYLRMALYALFPILAALGLGAWDEATGSFVITIQADHLAELTAAYVATYAGGFGISRWRKAQGGST